MTTDPVVAVVGGGGLTTTTVPVVAVVGGGGLTTTTASGSEEVVGGGGLRATVRSDGTVAMVVAGGGLRATVRSDGTVVVDDGGGLTTTIGSECRMIDVGVCDSLIGVDPPPTVTLSSPQLDASVTTSTTGAANLARRRRVL